MDIEQIKARIYELKSLHGCCVPYTEEEENELKELYKQLKELEELT